MLQKNKENDLHRLFRLIRDDPPPPHLRERVQADVDAHFPETATRSRRLWGPALAGTFILAALVLGVFIIPGGRNDVLAAVLEAMAEVKTVHITSESSDMEAWYSREHGIRWQVGTILDLYTPEATWKYDGEDNELVILEPDADFIAQSWRALSHADLLESLSTAPEVRCTTRRALLDGKPMMCMDVDLPDSQPDVTVWIDTETMRPVLAETWEERDGRRSVIDRTRAEYDAPVDPSLFVFEVPAGATVSDCRLDPEFREVLDRAMEAVKTVPLHETGEKVPEIVYHNSDSPYTWEAWRQHSLGYRAEYSYGTIRGGNPQEQWTFNTNRDRTVLVAHVEDQDMSYFSGPALRYLLALKRGEAGRIGRWPLDGPPEVIREEENGRTLAHFVALFTATPGPAERDASPERCKEVTTLDLGAKRLVEYKLYVRGDDQWRLAERVQFDYPEELPRGLFEFKPPPGAILEDLRKR